MRFCWYTLSMMLIPISDAMAYKTEKICKNVEATSREPAKKVCKRVLIMNDAQKALAEKEKKSLKK